MSRRRRSQSRRSKAVTASHNSSAPERTRTSTDHSVHKALNLARLPIPPQARGRAVYPRLVALIGAPGVFLERARGLRLDGASGGGLTVPANGVLTVPANGVLTVPANGVLTVPADGGLSVTGLFV